MAVIALHCPQHTITVFDINEKKIAEWNSDQLPIYEPGLLEVVQQARGRTPFFSAADIARHIDEAEIIFVSVNTPTKTYGVGAGMAADLQYWEQTARQILQHAQSSKIVIEKSTLPVKTAQAMENILLCTDNNICFDVLSNPEFLSEGSAIRDLQSPDRVLIGSHETEGGLKARNALVEIYANWVPRGKIITSSIWSSELSKIVSNAFLSQRISSINAISALCEKTGADIAEVAYAVGMDSRIGPKFLNASVGFGGSCFKKDILNLVYLCRHYGLNEVADYWEGVVKINQYQQERFILNMMSAMFNTLTDKKLCLFGFAFKADPGATRESPAIFIARRLLEEKAEIIITDPKALKNAQADLAGMEGRVSFEEDPYKAAEGCHAIAVMTEWDLYRTLDFQKIFDSMIKPASLFDGRNILDHRRCFEIGFNVYPIGKPPLTHFAP